MHRKNHASHYQTQSYNAYAGHNALYLLEVLVFTQILIEEKSHNHGHEGNHKDILKHTHCVDIDLGSGKPEHQQRGHERSQKSGYGGHTHRESHIALAEETHDIARHATRAASHENNAGSEIRVESENTSQSPCHKRHNGILRHCTYADVDRAAY